MSLITPDFGLFFWMLLAFGVVCFQLLKFACGRVLHGFQTRESSISEALSKAEQAHGEVLRMQEQSKALEAEGRAARVKMISEAERLREQMMREAREQAQAEAERYREESRQAMEQERVEARKALREEVGRLSIAVAERILRERLQQTDSQQAYVNRILDEVLAGQKE